MNHHCLILALCVGEDNESDHGHGHLDMHIDGMFEFQNSCGSADPLRSFQIYLITTMIQ